MEELHFAYLYAVKFGHFNNGICKCLQNRCYNMTKVQLPLIVKIELKNHLL